MFHQSQLFQALVDATLNNFFLHLLRLAFEVVTTHFDGLLSLTDFRRDFVSGHILHTRAGSDLHRHIAEQLLEHVATGHEVGFAVDFDQHTDAGSRVDVATNRTFSGSTARLLFGAGNAFLAQPFDCLVGITISGCKSFLAVHHSRASLVTQVLDELGGYGSSHRRRG